VSDDVVRVGTILPIEGEGDAGAVGRAARDVMVAALLQAKVHGRSIEVVVRHAPIGESLSTAKALMAEEEIFALVAPQTSGEEEAFARWAGESGVPVVAPFGGRPWTSSVVDEVFWLYGGPADQLRGVVQDTRGDALALVSAEGDGPSQDRVDAVIYQASRGNQALRRASHSDACAALALEGIEAVILEGPEAEARAWLEAASAEQCELDLYMTSDWVPPLLGDGAVPWFGRLFSTSPSRPADWTPRAVAELIGLVGEAEPKLRPVQAASLAATRLFLEGLEQAGPDLDRPALLVRMGAFQGFRTGLTPRLSYGPRRRVGALGAWIVERDPRTAQPLGGDSERWVAPR
jgi:ABC-type branched-subunit amino acid transport system substrate-binding protein